MKLLVCGTRKKGYDDLVHKRLDIELHHNLEVMEGIGNLTIIEGCCPNSADQYAEEWAKKNKVTIFHHPSTSGNYLKRNIEMVERCDKVICFWNGFSYGSCHTVAQAVMKGKPVEVIKSK